MLTNLDMVLISQALAPTIVTPERCVTVRWTPGLAR
jgi:hypothetical protein